MQQTKLFLTLVIVACSLFLFYSCEKESTFTEAQHETPVTEQPKTVVFNITDQEVQSRTGELVKTTLGVKRRNPFTVQKIAEAQLSLYPTAVSSIPTTDLYVKFLPADLHELKLLFATDEFFYDYPLEYEVVEMGDYYQELTEEELPTLYAIVDPGFDFSGLNYELISELYLDKSDRLLIAESFRLVGYTAEIPTYVFPIGIEDFDLPLNPPIEPDCPPGCVPVLIINTSTVPVSYEYYCDCTPPVIPTNSCGCEVYSSQRKPAGCIKVEDTQLSTSGDPSSFEGVRRVKVTMKDTWFTEDETWTDDSGCWKINEEYSGKAWMWVRFKNNRCSIRSEPTNVTKVWEWLSPVKDYVGSISGPNFSDIEVNYHMWTSQGSQAQRFWGTATVNNAVHEFHDEALIDGINLPPGNLDIFTGRFNNVNGFALMADKMGSELVELGIGQGLPENPNFLFPFSQLLDFFTAAQILVTFGPDVYIPINSLHSDRLNQTAYHEIAHASHFTQVGPIYWKDLVVAEVTADGHGDASSTDAGRIAVCESWADHVGHIYAHKKYPNNSVTSIFLTWEKLLEQTWNEVPDHVPVGLYFDLIDDGMELQSSNQNAPGSTTVVDHVSGFTNAQLFSSLTSSIVTIDQYRINLINNHLSSTGNTVQQLNDLFNSY